MPLHLVLAEAEVEVVPEPVRTHPQVQAVADDRGRPPEVCLLDASDHHAVLEDLPDGRRRGRPDIAHFCLLLALDSRLNQVGDLETRLHCRGDKVVDVDPETRLIRHYPRFRGLVEHLLQEGQVPEDREPPLLEITDDHALEDVLAEAPSPVVILDPDGDRRRPADVGDLVADGDATVVVGAFPEGGYRADVEAHADAVVALGEDPLMAWTAASEVLTHAADARGRWDD